MPSNIHKEILTEEQIKLLPLLRRFSANFGLVGGTAIGLHISHRQSIDFDLLSLKEFSNLTIKRKISHLISIKQILVNKLGEFTILLDGVKMTFFHYPFKIEFKKELAGIIKVPDLLTLAAMKAFALGMRAKWKDYVDLYFIIKHYHSLDKIIKKAQQIFGQEFNEKIFRTQLAYFQDIDYSEGIIFHQGFAVSDKEIKEELIKFSLS